MGQWMAGFCRAMRDENCQKSKEAMLDDLISLLDDSNDFSWRTGKSSHAVLLCRMEQGEIQSHQFFISKKVPLKERGGKSMICQFFNQNSCIHSATHETKGVVYRHICAYCHSRSGKSLPHSKNVCRNKNREATSKNE